MVESSWWFWGGLLPLAVSFAAMFVWRQPWRPVSPVSAALSWTAAVFDGYAVGALLHLAIKQPLPFPPVEAPHYLAMVLLPMVAVIEIVGAALRHRKAHWLLRGIAIMATPPHLLRPILEHEWSVGQSIAWCTGLSLGIAVVWVLLDSLAARSDRRSPWLAMTLAATGAGVTLLASGSAVLGQLGLTLAISLAGAWFAGILINGPVAQRGGLGVALILLAGLLINGYFYASLKPLHALVLAMAPLAAWVGQLPPIRRLKPWQASLVVVILTGVVVAVVTAPAAITAQREASEAGN